MIRRGVKAREIATSVKFWLGAAAVVLGSLAALGATIDRPAWHSEVEAVAEQTAANAREILQNKIDRVQQRVWDQEDRQTAKPTSDGAQRLRELREQLRRLLERMKAKG